MFLIIGCERKDFSPVEIKIDEGDSYSPVEVFDAGSFHTVSKGETLFDIAYKYNIDPMNLAKLNGIKTPYGVKDGQVLRLPSNNVQLVETENKFPQYASALEEHPKKEEANNDELDAEFSTVIAAGKAKKTNIPSKGSSLPANGSTFNEQEEILSVPKVTKSAIGIDTSRAEAIGSNNQVVPPLTKSASSVKMIYPVVGKVISSYGDVKDGISNDGINIQAPHGTPAKAASGGEVIYAGNKLEELGNTVIVQHDNGLVTSYSHLDNIKVKEGAKLKAGDTLGTVGSTGDVKDPQLHFEVLKEKNPVDPIKYLTK